MSLMSRHSQFCNLRSKCVSAWHWASVFPCVDPRWLQNALAPCCGWTHRTSPAAQVFVHLQKFDRSLAAAPAAVGHSLQQGPQSSPASAASQQPKPRSEPRSEPASDVPSPMPPKWSGSASRSPWEDFLCTSTTKAPSLLRHSHAPRTLLWQTLPACILTAWRSALAMQHIGPPDGLGLSQRSPHLSCPRGCARPRWSYLQGSEPTSPTALPAPELSGSPSLNARRTESATPCPRPGSSSAPPPWA
mmetsp:Transcript_16722/g.28481  ORF Transcript_16722/g.28481 Transcript_16722/m.28481 type:complete len:246 (-) Transcript_16722:477-1214(-)